MLTCMYQPPVSLGKTCLLKVNRDTKKVVVRQFTQNKGGQVRVELVQSYNFLSSRKKSGGDIEKARRPCPPKPDPPSNDEDEDDENEDSTDPESDDASSLSETCGLNASELEEMAARQARQLETQEQLLAAKAQRLRYLKSGGEAERLQRLREKVAAQEERLRKLRALRGKVHSNRNGNSALSSDLESLRAVFSEKEKELSVAVAKVDELTRQLEDLRRGNKDSPNGTLSNNTSSNGQSTASMELEKLRRELMYRQKLREAQATRVAVQRTALSQRQEEANRVDRRIAELQERLHRKRFLNHQLSSTLKHQENVEEIVGNGVPTKNDPKYQTLPYNAKFTPFGVKQQQAYYESMQNVQDQAKYDKAIQQMQIITLDQQKHQPPSPQQQLPENNNKMINNLSNNFQLHQILSQNHQNTKSAKSNNVLDSSIQQQSTSTPQLLTNGIGHGLHHLPKGKSMSAIGSNDSQSNGYPLVRPSNFLPTGASNPTTNSEINGLLNSQSGTTTRDVSSFAGSNASISGSSSDGIASSNQCSSDGKNSTSRPALPPKPSKPTPPLRQGSTGDVFSYNQRILTTGDGTGVIPDRTELPIKPKPLFLKKMTSEGSITIGTSSVLPSSVSSIGSSSQDKDPYSTGNGNGNNSTVRMSINRRIEMPPAFLFPESDPPPSDLVPEQHLSSATSSLSSTSITSSAIGGVDSRNSDNGLRPCDTVDASSSLHLHQKGNSHFGIEEYTLPDLFPNPSTNLNVKNTFTKILSNSNPALPPSPNNNTNQYPSAFTLSQGQVNQTTHSTHYSNHTNNNNNYQQSLPNNETSSKLMTGGKDVSPNGNTFETHYDLVNGQHQHEVHHDQVSVMSVQLDRRSPGTTTNEEEFSQKSKQLDSPEAVLENWNQSSGTELNFVGEEGSVTSSNNDSSTESSVDMQNNGETESNKGPHPSLPGIIKRLKKGNLKSANKDSPGNGRRVSFDPLALLLDASLEGELELVMKTAKEVGNPSAANDEGITALHNAICAGHVEVVRFLVEFGCDVNAQDSDGWTPLHCAASCNNVGVVKFLVERGACIFATTLSDHETAAEKCEEDEDGFGPCSEYLYSIQEKLGIINNGVVYTVFDYEAQNPDELSFNEGERLTVIRKGDEFEREWWWSSTESDTQGYIPRNLLGLYPRVVPQKRKPEG